MLTHDVTTRDASAIFNEVKITVSFDASYSDELPAWVVGMPASESREGSRLGWWDPHAAFSFQRVRWPHSSGS